MIERRAAASGFRNSFIKIVTGSVVTSRRLPLMNAGSGQPGPVICLSACSHGDEVGGIVVVQELFKRLHRNPLRRGRIMAFPMMNPIGFETSSRHIIVSSEDLNRAFPGNPEGSVAERIAHLVFSNIARSGADLVLDLHNDWRRSIPHTLIDPCPDELSLEAWQRARELARRIGFLVIHESHDSGGRSSYLKTLTYSLISAGIPALTLELGESFVVNERNVDTGVCAIWQLLVHLGMVERLPERLDYPVPERLLTHAFRYCDRPYASTSGIVRFMVKPADTVHAGRPVARIYNAFGRLQETIRAEADGIVLGHSDFSAAYPGVPLIAFGISGSPVK